MSKKKLTTFKLDEIELERLNLIQEKLRTGTRTGTLRRIIDDTYSLLFNK